MCCLYPTIFPPAGIALPALWRNLRPRSSVSFDQARADRLSVQEILPGFLQQWRKLLQANGYRMLSDAAVNDSSTETDEVFQNAGEKGDLHPDPGDRPRHRANKHHGHGNYDNDCPPIVGTIGRTTGKCRLQVVMRTDGKTLQQHVHRNTRPESVCYTDEWRSYNGIKRKHPTVNHRLREWARDDDGDGIREVHGNTIERLWTEVRNFLRPFRGVHKKYLKYYVAICEHRINHKRISPTFIAQLVVAHSSFT